MYRRKFYKTYEIIIVALDVTLEETFVSTYNYLFLLITVQGAL